MLTGRTLQQAEAILGGSARDLDRATDDGLSVYELRCGDGRYLYRLMALDGVVVEAEFTNLSFLDSGRNFLSGIEPQEVALCSDLAQLEEALEILPTHLWVSGSDIMLSYGVGEEYKGDIRYPLTVQLWNGSMRLIGFEFLEG